MLFRVVGLSALFVVLAFPVQAYKDRLGLTEYAIASRWQDFDRRQRWSFASWAVRRINSTYKLGLTRAEHVERTVELHDCMHGLLGHGGLTVLEHTHLSTVIELCWKLTQQRRIAGANS
ncbi:MAG: hypothetical protein ACR2PA_19370 [Hyphomicrobiaceae bacterium]